MTEATLIYPHQLFKTNPAIAAGRVIYLVEETLLLNYNPSHRSRLLLLKLALDTYQTQLEAVGHRVERITLAQAADTTAVFSCLRTNKIAVIHVVDTVDEYLERALNQSGFERVWYESPMFLLSQKNAIERFVKSKKFMANFYKKMRQDFEVLLEADGTPTGGAWSFDSENRKKIPRGMNLPDDIQLQNSTEIQLAQKWVEGLPGEKYGEAVLWLPYDAAGAQKFLEEFLRTRLQNFGPYEDALTTNATRLWHSTLSPLLNIGLLTPRQVLDVTLKYAENNDVPLNSLEGFIRQLIGWREFIRASYVADGSVMRQQNFFNHQTPLPKSFWTAETELPPVDRAIKTTLQFGYNHHIERLMVMGNILLLLQIHPTEIYRWFMGMYIDAYDWVMVPNVYGMSQFADGGSFATKPYISGSNYLKKMSDYAGGDWEAIWTALYWNFIHNHKEFFKSNHRLSMMPRLLEKMETEKRDTHLHTAKEYVSQLK